MILEKSNAINLGNDPQEVPIRSLRRLLRDQKRIEVAVEIDGYALLCRVSKREILRTVRRAWKRGARTVPVSDLLGIVVVG